MTQGLVLCLGIKGSLRIEKERWRLQTISAQTAKTKEVETFFYSQLREICFTVLQTRCTGADVGLLRHKRTRLWKYHKNNPLFRNNPLTFEMKKKKWRVAIVYPSLYQQRAKPSEMLVAVMCRKYTRTGLAKAMFRQIFN